MSLTAISSLELARRKFLMSSTSHQLAKIGEKKIFMNSTYIMSGK